MARVSAPDGEPQGGAVTEGAAGLVVLFDVDDTLLDGGGVKAAIGERIGAALGAAEARRFWREYEAAREERGHADVTAAMRRFARGGGAGVLAALAEAVYGVGFAALLHPGALEAIAHARTLGAPAVLSDGDPRFQRHKIRAAGIEAAVGGRVLVCAHKERELDEVRARWPARRYAVLDDRPRILAAVKRALGADAATIHVAQGPHAGERAEPPPDLRLASIGEFASVDGEALRAAAAGAA